MAVMNVNPTRMELTNLKKKLVTARRGHKLLKDKRDELMRRTSISSDNPETKVARASGIEDMVTDELIAFYEKEIAKDTFISSMTTMKKNRLMSAYDINEKRLYLTLILQDLGARVDDHKDFNQIAQMNDKQLFSYGKTLVLSFIDTLTEEEKARLKDGFKSALGM